MQIPKQHYSSALMRKENEESLFLNCFIFSCRIEDEDNFFTYSWKDDFAKEEKLKISNDRQAHFVVRGILID